MQPDFWKSGSIAHHGPWQILRATKNRWRARDFAGTGSQGAVRMSLLV